MQVIATGKWSKAEKRWKMVVALRRWASGVSASAAKPRDPRRNVRPSRYPKIEN